MFTSDNRRHFVRAAAASALFSIFLLIFGLIYDHYGRGVHSLYMSYAFAIPFVLCTVPYFLLSLYQEPERSRFAFNVHNSGVAVLSFASIFRGIVRIAGTASKYERPLIIAGAAICLVGAVTYLVTLIVRSKK